MNSTSTALRHDIVVFGATSFVGQILCRYLLQRHGVGQGLRWAIAARSAAKLDELKRSLGPAAVALESIVVDAADEAGLRRLCHDTRVVVSTVGPYALYGETLVKVCADTGTDYCDLTGEVQWIRRTIRAPLAAAAERGSCTAVVLTRYPQTLVCGSCSASRKNHSVRFARASSFASKRCAVAFRVARWRACSTWSKKPRRIRRCEKNSRIRTRYVWVVTSRVCVSRAVRRSLSMRIFVVG